MGAFSINLSSQWSATLYTAGVSLGITFVLGRILGPEGFGAYNYVLTIGTLFFIFQDGGFKTLLFREKTLPSEVLKGHEDHLPSYAIGHTLMVTGAGLLLVWVFPATYRLGLLAAVICFGCQAIVNFVSSRLKGEGLFPCDAIWQVMVRTLSAVGIFLTIYLVTPALWTIFAGWSLGLLICLLLSPRRIQSPLFGGFRIRDIRKACLYLMAVDGATTVYHRFDIILLERLTGPEIMGYYAAAYRFLDGVILLAAPLSIIWFRKMRMVWKDERSFWLQVGRMSAVMLGVSSCIIVTGGLLSEWVVAISFGPSYTESSHLLPWLLGALLFLLPNGILTQAAIARNREGLYALAAGVGAVLNILLNVCLIPQFGGLGAAWATIGTEAFLMAALIWGLRKADRLS